MKTSQETCPTDIYRLDPCRADLAALIRKALLEIAGENAAELAVFSALDIFGLLEKPPETALGDYAFPCFRFAKPTKIKPIDIATQLAAKISAARSPWVDEVKTAGAFCNVFINKTAMARQLLPSVLNGRYFAAPADREAPKSQRVMIEYSQPNTHKEFHVGHARNVCLGSSLVNTFRYCGYPVIAANYFGDEGAHIAKCLWHVQKTGAKAPATNRDEWLGLHYTAACKMIEEASDEDRKVIEAGVSEILRAIESKSGETYKYWRETRQWSLDAFDEIYEWFGVKFDRLFYESEVSEASQDLVEEYLKKGLFIEDGGAVGVDLKPYKLGFMLTRKRDGNTLYATKDIVLARKKFEEYKIDRSIYVVANEQAHHFRQVFKTLELIGFEQAKQCFHLSYGMVVLPEGKMSSRDGTSITFSSLKNTMTLALGEHLAKYEGEWSREEIDACAHALCNGALRYGMLSTDAAKDVVFDMANWISFEGNSGPYLMYSYTRTQSILRKAAESGEDVSTQVLATMNPESLKEASEHELLRFIYDFNDAAIASAENYRPSLITTHLFQMCKAFNRFYADVSVLKAEDKDTLRARLALTYSFGAVLRQGLELLGIKAPARM